MAQITFDDKEKLIDNPDIDEKNKLTADNVNEIKRVVNENGALSYDNLPVGSIIEYDGIEIPDGYEEIENKKVLFDGKENNSLILNDDVNNYSKLVIIFCANNVYNSIIVDNPNGKTVSLFTSYMVDANTLKISSKNITLSGTTISIGNCMEWNNTWGNANITSSKSNSIYITKIIGYKQEAKI